ncbi:MAG: APC family permease [Candidatus Rokubacteria bacterium]|nr:APC family permease [Candidatus Rokubacteria bacterium]
MTARPLTLAPLAAIVFFNVSGGPYGIEDMVPSFGPGLTLLLLVLTPLVWSLPVTLAMAELASAMPDEGGYVVWVERAFGRFWSFQVGWWSWIDSFIDVAIYPALFVEYLRFWLPAMTPGQRWLAALAFIAVLTGLNVVGVRPAGRAAIALAIAALVPAALLVLAGLPSLSAAAWTPLLAPGRSLGAGLGLGLAVVMWNYSGWDTASTCLGETAAPERAFRRALLVALPVITAAYVVPMAVALGSAAAPWTAWKTGFLPTVAERIGGRGLGALVALGAVVSTAGLFLSLLLTNSRLPFVLARQGQLPAALGRVHRRFATPWVAVVVSAACYGALAAFSFRELIVLNVWLYSLTILVELAAFLRLRLAAPALARPWRVPGGAAVAWVVTVVPCALALLAMSTAGWWNTVAGVLAALTGPAIYAAWRPRAAAPGCPR